MIKYILTIACAVSSSLAGSATTSYAQVAAAPDSAVVAPVQQESARLTTYGISDLAAYVVGAYDFTPSNSATTHDGGPAGDRFLTSAGTLYATVHLPSGARIHGIEIQGCDTSLTAGLTATLYSSTVSFPGQSEIEHGSASSGALFNIGCGFFPNTLVGPTVNNTARTYYVGVTTGATDSAVRFSAVRIYYKLQVSPAPAVATFADVPTNHPLFAFVEALARAGITGGCGGSNYCPDTPVTRGQLAVFLSTALGLHWPN
jgi:hypothetical protein